MNLPKINAAGFVEPPIRYVQTTRPVCQRCECLMAQNGKSGRVHYWRCPKCGRTDKTILKLIF